MTWQKFYEMYDLYGENNSVWNEYINSEVKAAEAVTSGVGLASIFNWLKGINLDDVQIGINNLQRVIGFFKIFQPKIIQNLMKNINQDHYINILRTNEFRYSI